MSETKAIDQVPLLLREPRESESAVCRMLLPEACANPTDRLFRLAFESPGNRIVGAFSYLDDTQSLVGIRLHVVKARRRSGIGSRLMQHILDEAQGLGRKRVVVDADLKKEPDAEPFLTALGFRIAGRLTSVHGPIVGRGPKRELFEARLAGAEPLPPTARMTGISEAPAGQISQLYAEHIASVPMMSGIHRTFRPEQFPESVVVMVDGNVIGFMLAHVTGDTVHVPAVVVLPEYRGKRLAIRMIAAMEERLGQQVTRGEFEFADSAIFTAKIAAEFGHEVSRIGVRFERKT
jgi:GNAT superfamily N-acetyltransferase